MKRFLLDALFPRFCLGCKREGSVWCESCASTFAPPRPHVGCPFCDAPGSDATCAACRPSRALDGLTAPFAYGNPSIRGAITGYKFSGDAAYAEVLTKWLRARISLTAFPTRPPVPNASLPLHKGELEGVRVGAPFDAVVAIPLHQSRLHSRGFNQADLVAREVAAALGCPVISPLVRARKTAPQSSLAHAERKADGLAGAFTVPLLPNESLPLHKGELEGVRVGAVPARILLCDDVFTSGATMNAAATALKQAGAKVVWGFAVAKG